MSEEQALAKLVKQNDSVMVRRLPFFFGRTSEKSSSSFMDICVDGVDKTVSREYASIGYSEEKKSYYLDVKGKQGAYVNQKYVMRNEKCCLYNNDAISILNCKFYFLLPIDSVHISNAVDSIKRSSESTVEDASSKRQLISV